MTERSRTVVIGAGVIGLACAHALRLRGDDVVVIEQDMPGEACSRGNAGWIVPCLAEPLPAPGLTGTSLRWMLNRDSPLHIDPWMAPRLAGWLWAFWRRCNTADYRAGRAAWAQLTEHVLESFDALVADGVAVEMHCSGVLFVYLRESTMLHALHEIAEFRRPDAPTIQPLVGDELRRFEPALRADVRAGFWVPEERHVRPESLCAGLLRRITELGVEVQTGTAVVGGTLDGRTLRAVRTAHGDVTGDRFLIAAGAWSGLVSERIARIPLPVQAGKGYSVTVTAAQPPIQRPMYLSEARVGCTPFVGGYRYAGTMELSGINERLIPSRVSAIRRAVGRYLRPPEPPTDGVEWVGMRPLTPDGLPIIGRLPQRENVFVASGHAMLGVTSALVTATLIADLLAGGEPSPTSSPFDPGRFGRSHST